jgi:DnaJ-class molecular chaperone
VKTVYGPAQIQSIRSDDVHIAKPINWKLANNTIATLYLQPDAMALSQTPGFEEGDEVMTVYGQGFVQAKRAKEGDLVILLRNWALAQGTLERGT